MPGAGIDPYTNIYALTGSRMFDSWLPAIHNALFTAEQLNAVCVPLPCSSERELDMLALLGDGLNGMFLTGDMMELGCARAEVRDEYSRALGLSDILTVDAKGRACAYNTLVNAVISAVRENWMNVEDRPALVVGSGRMAKICAYALIKEDAQVMLCARNPLTLSALQADLENATGREVQTCAPGEAYGEFSVLIHATPFGSASTAHRDMGQASPVPDELLERCSALIECVTAPVQTDLLVRADNLGLKTVPALELQLSSAVATHNAFHIKLPVKKTLKETLTKLRTVLRDAR